MLSFTVDWDKVAELDREYFMEQGKAEGKLEMAVQNIKELMSSLNYSF